MRHIRNFLYLLLGVTISLVVLMPYAQAQALPTYSGFDHLSRIITAAPSVTTVGTSYGVAANASGVVNVTTNGLKIAVPTTATATISKTALAGLGLKAMRVGSMAGWVFTGYEVYTWAKNSGMKVCSADQGFFCKPATDTTDGFVWQVSGFPASNASTALGACILAYPQYATTMTAGYLYSNTRWVCSTWPKPPGQLYEVDRLTLCQAGFTLKSGVCVRDVALPDVGLTDADIEQTLQQKMDADFNQSKSLYDALRADMKNKGLAISQSEVVPASTPVTVTAQPVTTPQTTTRTVTITNPDGTTSTVTTKQQVTVTPSVTGSTVSDTVINYSPQTTSTTTNTNNSTNQTTTTSSVANSPAAQPAANELQFPTDYNREATQQKMLDELKKQDCELNPNRAGCAEFDTPPVSEDIPTKEIPATYSLISFASPAGCPAPIPYALGFGMTGELSFQPMCDFASYLRPIFLACAACSCAFIFLGAVKL